MIEDQRGLPSFHGCGDELCDYRADLLNSHALRDPGMWYTVKSLLVVSPVCRQVFFLVLQSSSIILFARSWSLQPWLSLLHPFCSDGRS